jgi:formate-dependent nitrite reductase membrane component NrfD
MNGSRVEAAVSAQYLLAGGYAVAFWVGVVVIGIVAPLALLIWKAAQHGKVTVSLGLLVAICLLIGGVVLRYAILAAGYSTASTL